MMFIGEWATDGIGPRIGAMGDECSWVECAVRLTIDRRACGSTYVRYANGPID